MAEGLRIGVFSDTHVGRNIPRVLRDARRRAFRHAFRQAIDIFIENDVDYVIHAGDLFEKRSMTPDDAVFVKWEFYRLVKKVEERSGKKIKIIAVRGNHDGSPLSSALDFITHPMAEYFQVIGEGILEGVKEAYVGDGLSVIGMGYHPYARRKFQEASEILREIEADGYRILILHNYVEAVHDIPPQTPEHSVIRLEDLERLDVDLVITGHHHERLGFKKTGGKLFLIPGATEAIDLGERGPFGVYILDVEKSGLISHKFVELEPLQVIGVRRVVSDKPVELDWFRRRCLEEIESFALNLDRDGILKLNVSGVVAGDEPFPQLGLQEEVQKLMERYDKLIHVEISEDLSSMIRPDVRGVEGRISRDEIVREVFGVLGERAGEAAEIVEDVAMALDEKASERTGLLKELDRRKFSDRWLRFLSSYVGEGS
ncbi:MAG: hypothetical protein B6U65_01555 [Candidatus Wolframiiraptor sp. EX4484-121]|nr:MAG: hypothetical protein B6U65_01555 [Candidatus Wolframiiraptor sp. EX4484-121]